MHFKGLGLRWKLCSFPVSPYFALLLFFPSQYTALALLEVQLDHCHSLWLSYLLCLGRCSKLGCFSEVYVLHWFPELPHSTKLWLSTVIASWLILWWLPSFFLSSFLTFLPSVFRTLQINNLLKYLSRDLPQGKHWLVSLKMPNSKFFRLCGPCHLCLSHLTMSLEASEQP